MSFVTSLARNLASISFYLAVGGGGGEDNKTLQTPFMIYSNPKYLYTGKVNHTL